MQKKRQRWQKRGKGSLVGSIISHDENFIAETSWKMASQHGRIFVLNRDNAKESTGHGSPLPTLSTEDRVEPAEVKKWAV